jgi:hypothetical protein
MAHPLYIHYIHYKPTSTFLIFCHRMLRKRDRSLISNRMTGKLASVRSTRCCCCLILPFRSRVLSIFKIAPKFRISTDLSVYSYVFLLFFYLNSYILWDITSYMPAKIKPSLAYCRPGKMEVTCSSETSGDFHCNTKHYISEDRKFQDHTCKNLKSNNISISFGSTCMH